MRRVLFLANEKNGYTFLSSMLLGQAGNWGTWKESVTCPVWLPTVPPKQAKFFLKGYVEGHMIDDVIRGRPEVDGMEVYTWEPPGVLDPSFYDSLPGDDWRFVYLLRDPRNKIESLCKRAGGRHGTLSKDARKAAFENQCKASAAQMVSVCKVLDDPRIMLLRFEDLIADPVGKMEEVFKFIGLKADLDVIKKVVEEREISINSSYDDLGAGSKERWHAWTDEELAYFKSVIGPGFLTLGYEKDFGFEIPKKKVEPKPAPKKVEEDKVEPKPEPKKKAVKKEKAAPKKRGRPKKVKKDKEPKVELEEKREESGRVKARLWGYEPDKK